MSKTFNGNTLVGEIFGDWTVLSFFPCEEKKAHWLCRCICGVEKPVRANDLKRGKNQSCGCSRRKDITNQRFGKLIAISPTNIKSSSNSIIWNVKCDCGRETTAPVHQLINGSTKSCGCFNMEDLSNQTFGLLTTIKRSFDKDKAIGNYAMWECKCSCGSIHTASSYYLKHGNNQSCGCLRSKGQSKISKFLTEYNIKYIPEYTFDDLRSNIGGLLRFDFAIYINNKLAYLIEYDGSQHFEYTNNGWNTKEKFLQTKENDNLKNQYCKDNNIPLIRIPYTHFDFLTGEDICLNTTQFLI